MSSIPLKIKSVGKTFDKKNKVISDVSFEVKPGEIFGLIGLNGVGKTTLIKVILDLLRATDGEAEIFGVNSRDFKSRKKLAYLPEKFVPSQLLKGKEFLDLSLDYYGKMLEIEEAEFGAEKLGLDPKVLQNRVGKYSKGMSQKLGLLGSFLSEAPLLILDEPMSGLDPRARVQLKDYLLDYRNQKRTIFFSSHILSDIDEICDRVGVIHDGGLKFLGTPKEMKQEFGEQILERAFLNCIDGKKPEKKVAAKKSVAKKAAVKKPAAKKTAKPKASVTKKKTAKKPAAKKPAKKKLAAKTKTTVKKKPKPKPKAKAKAKKK